jgi:hypothetical protein
VRLSDIGDDSKPKPETASCSLKRLPIVRNMIDPNEFNGFPSEQSNAIELTIVEEHLTEAEVIRSG